MKRNEREMTDNDREAHRRLSDVLLSHVPDCYQGTPLAMPDNEVRALADEAASAALAVLVALGYRAGGDAALREQLLDLILGHGAVLWQNRPDDPRTFEVRRDGKHVGFVNVTDQNEVVWV